MVSEVCMWRRELEIMYLCAEPSVAHIEDILSFSVATMKFVNGFF